MTPDEDFILDHHPLYDNIIIGAGFSGVSSLLVLYGTLKSLIHIMTAHGFKMAPVVGKLLKELALNQTPYYDLTPFSFRRFSSP